MVLVLDTCLYIRKDSNQSKVPSFDYDYLEKIIEENDGSIYISPFSLQEIFMIRKYTTINDLQEDLAINAIRPLVYDLDKLRNDFSKYDIVNKYAAVAFYHLTEFLEFFVCNILFDKINAKIDDIKMKIREQTDLFYKELNQVDLSNCTKFMKEKAIFYIVGIIKNVLNCFNIIKSDLEIWKMIGNSKIKSGVPFDTICNQYLRYARFLVSLFNRKCNNKAKIIRLSFSFNDLLISKASDCGFIVLTSDRDLSKYLLKYGNNQNKDIIRKLWKEKLEPVEW